MLSTEEFAQQLIERLEKVQIEREQEERAAVNLAGPPREVSSLVFLWILERLKLLPDNNGTY